MKKSIRIDSIGFLYILVISLSLLGCSKGDLPSPQPVPVPKDATKPILPVEIANKSLAEVNKTKVSPSPQSLLKDVNGAFDEKDYALVISASASLNDKYPNTPEAHIAEVLALKAKKTLEEVARAPFEFKGIQLGAALADVKRAFKGIVKLESKPPTFGCLEESKYAKCSNVSNLTIVNRMPEQAVFNFLPNNKLGRIIILLDQKYFEAVQEAIIKKYGKPETEEITPLANKFTGVESSYKALKWVNINGDDISLSNHMPEGSDYNPKSVLSFTSADMTTLIDSLGKDSDDKDI